MAAKADFIFGNEVKRFFDDEMKYENEKFHFSFL